MWATNYKGACLFSFFLFYGFQCQEDASNYYTLKIESPASQYKEAFYMLGIDPYFDNKFLKIKPGENTTRKMWGVGLGELRILNRSCNQYFGNNSTPTDAHILEVKFTGRPFMDLLELKFPEAKNFNKILIDLNDKDCAARFERGQRINLKNPPFLFPVRPDTFNRIYISIDDVVVLDDSIYVGTEKIIKEIK